MTTLVRVQPQIVPTSGTIGNVFAPAVEKTTFQPVNDTVIQEIIGLAALGIGELGGTEGKDIPAHLYKWHTWLHRMNTWMKRNKAAYPKQLGMRDVHIPAHLYFLGTVSLDDVDRQVALSRKTPLGPLLPADKNTFLNAIKKGSSHCQNSNAKDFISFVNDVDKISISATGDKSRTDSFNELYLEDDLSQEKYAEMNPALEDPIKRTRSRKPRVIRTIETFAGKAKLIPLWGWVLILVTLFYFVNKKGSTEQVRKIGGTRTLRDMSTTWSGTGGATRRVIF
jgi:hypothetical protein